MATGFDHLMSTTPLPAIGKVKVGEPPAPPAGKKGITIAVALFFDGTLNNRSNTEKRIATHDKIIDGKKKNGRSSYGGFYSNVAVMEYMNLRRDPAKKEVSVYVEGIGTVDYLEKEEKAGKAQADISNDDETGYAFGTGPTGIWDRVTKGIRELRSRINKKGFYNLEKEYIKKIEVDVVGFSRGAAAARHFVSRRAALEGPWRNGEQAEVVINFVGIYDTVSSYEGKISEHSKYINAASKITEGSADRGIFEDDVKELSLDMYGVPKRVVHLTAADEYRSNFALTNIKSSLNAGVGFEMALPGVHSDVGGGYVEPDPNNMDMDPHCKIRSLNQEVRYFFSYAGMQESLVRGWYVKPQIVPWQQEEPVVRSRHTWFGDTPEVRLTGYKASRYLTNQYQYVALFIMLDFAQHGAGRPGGKAHTEMRFESLDLPENTKYRVPADLVKFRDQFLGEAIALTGTTRTAQVRLLRNQVLPPLMLPPPPPTEPPAPDPVLPPTTPDDLRWLRNKYLHRSAHSLAEGRNLSEGVDAYIGMDGNYNMRRVVIRDTVRLDTFSKPYIDKANKALDKVKNVRHKLDELRDLF